MSTNTSSAVNLTVSTYQNKVIKEAVKRAGHCKNIKGHILEICYKDRYNCDIGNIIHGRHAQLTKNAFAKRDDLVVIEGGKVIKRIQCKDTPSAAGTMDTVKRIKNGQYARTNVVGTTESAESINKALENSKTKTRVQDSKISTKTTELMALQANGANPLKHLDLVANHAGKVAAGGAIIGGGISAVLNGRKVIMGKLDVKEALTNVAMDTGKSTVSAAVGGAVDVSVTMALALTPVAPVAKPIGTAVGIGTGIVVDKGIRSIERGINSKIDRKIHKRNLNANDGYGYLKRCGII